MNDKEYIDKLEKEIQVLEDRIIELVELFEKPVALQKMLSELDMSKIMDGFPWPK